MIKLSIILNVNKKNTNNAKQTISSLASQSDQNFELVIIDSSGAKDGLSFYERLELNKIKNHNVVFLTEYISNEIGCYYYANKAKGKYVIFSTAQVTYAPDFVKNFNLNSHDAELYVIDKERIFEKFHWKNPTDSLRWGFFPRNYKMIYGKAIIQKIYDISKQTKTWTDCNVVVALYSCFIASTIKIIDGLNYNVIEVDDPEVDYEIVHQVYEGNRVAIYDKDKWNKEITVCLEYVSIMLVLFEFASLACLSSTQFNQKYKKTIAFGVCTLSSYFPNWRNNKILHSRETKDPALKMFLDNALLCKYTEMKSYIKANSKGKKKIAVENVK